MRIVSRRGFIEAAALAGGGAVFGQGSQPASARLRASEEDAKLAQVQVMIGNGCDYEFLQMFERFSDCRIRVSPSPGAYRDLMPDPASSTTRNRRVTDVIVLFDQVYDMPEENQQSLRRYVEAGKGIVVLHNALTDYQRWAYWYSDVVGASFLIRDAQMPKSFAMKKESGPAEELLPDHPASSPDKLIGPGVFDFQEYLIKPVGDHPILAGIQPFTVRDEKYKSVWQSDKIKPLLVTDDPDSDKVVGWIGPHPKARVFACMLGHSAESHAHPVYRQIVHNAILWAAGRRG